MSSKITFFFLGQGHMQGSHRYLWGALSSPLCVPKVLASEGLEGKVKAPWPGCGLSIGVAAFETFDRVPSSVTLER